MPDMIDKLLPKWDYRRKYILALLIFLCVMIVASLAGALYLGHTAMFGLYISAFMIVFVICAFMSLLGIIGSYIFGSRWETKDFLDTLPNIIPKFGEEEKKE
jgi:hypothetical protein